MSDAQKRKVLKPQTARLKRLVAEAMLDVATLKDIASKTTDADVKRHTVVLAMKNHAVSKRQTCSLAGLDRSTF